jgi:transcriptional regulator with XRE-family HTH domain
MLSWNRFMYVIVAKQHRPTAAHRPVTETWKRLVEEARLERGITRQALAELVGASPAGITVLLRPETRSSRLVDLVSAALEIPTPDFVDERDAEVIANLRFLRTVDPAEYDRHGARIAASAHKLKRKP